MSKLKIKVRTLVLFEAATGRVICSLLAFKKKKLENDKKQSPWAEERICTEY